MSVSTIVTQGFGSFGNVNLVPTLGFGVASASSGLLGGKAYSYHTPYSKYKEEEFQKKTAEAKRAALREIDQELAEAERLRKLQLAKAERLKTEKALAKLAAEEIKTLNEIDRLRTERAWLIRRIDEEETILVLLMSMPFIA